jgi:hypothetical protein
VASSAIELSSVVRVEVEVAGISRRAQTASARRHAGRIIRKLFRTEVIAVALTDEGLEPKSRERLDFVPAIG